MIDISLPSKRDARHRCDDDHVCPDTLDMGWHVWCDEFGIEIKTQYAKDSEGVTTGYHFECPITDLRDGFDMVKPSTYTSESRNTRASMPRMRATCSSSCSQLP